MTVIVVPYRPPVLPDRSLPFRADALRLVELHLRELPPPFVVRVVADENAAGLFSRGRAVNVATASLGDDTVFVMNDADTVCPHASVVEACRLAKESPGLVYCYTTYHRLTERATAELVRLRPLFDGDLFEQAFEGPFERELVRPPAQGCAAITAGCFREIGGYDDRFVGWGYEDIDLLERAAAAHPVRRVAGPAVHFWHCDRRGDDSPVDADAAVVAANLTRWKRGDR